MAPPFRPGWPVLLGVLVWLASCEDPINGPTPLTAGTPVAPQALGQPATPGPRVIPTARVQPTPDVATPPPATPPPPAPSPAVPIPPSPTPSPGTPITSPTPTGPAMATPGPSPSPDRYKKTGAPLDLAISGPAYFVLATKPNPETIDDLFFTKQGHFKLSGDAAGSLSLFRLRHADQDFHVVGYMIVGGTGAGGPDETTSADGVVFKTMWGPLETAAVPLVLDAERNPEAPVKTAFDFSGRMKIGDGVPRAPDGSGLQVYVALAQFGNPGALVPRVGLDGMFRYAPNAGTVSLGVAVTGAKRPVGNANTIVPATLEIAPP